MKKIIVLLLLLMILPSCSEQYYQRSVADKFDTIITITAPAMSDEDFNAFFKRAEELINFYHQLFDAYNEYDAGNNIASINLKAAEEPIKVDDEMVELLSLSKSLYQKTEGNLNIALGAVTTLWREAGENSILPNEEELRTAANHINPDDIVIDTENSTIYLADPEIQLDVGGIAKGYAAQRICDTLKAEGYDNFLLSMGGNISAVGNKDGDGWTVGIENPDTMSSELVKKVQLFDGYSLVVSGDYHRYFEIDGIEYGHIINPTTLYPPNYHSSVAVISKSSVIADAFSTALFNLEKQDAMVLANKQSDIEVMLITKAGEIIQTEGFADYTIN